MAWGVGGEEARAACKLALANCRSATYALEAAARNVRHPEKGPRLRELAGAVWEHLDKIDKQLSR